MNSLYHYKSPVSIPPSSTEALRKQFFPLIFFIPFISFTLCSCEGKKIESNSEPTITPKQQANTLRILKGVECKECKLMFLGMPLQLSPVDTSEGWQEDGTKLIVEGTILQPDGTTPAPDVILYYYHTDPGGNYTPIEGMLPSARQHGHLRGWIKTGSDGRYSIYTSRPGPYPNENIAAHIHVYIKEPYLDVPYPLDEWIFDDDPLVTKEIRSKLQNMGGNPILTIVKKNDVQRTNHDIILGQNIAGYPK
jgi:protocatechuate 3,4-dioxygenase beta subunit